MAAKGSILVIDNEKDQLEMMRGVLERIGYKAQTTDNPSQALALVKKHAFDLVFLDLIMPEIDGTDLCEQIKRIQPETGIYAYSGHAHLYSSQQLARVGFAGTINKPATMQEIQKALDQAIDAGGR